MKRFHSLILLTAWGLAACTGSLTSNDSDDEVNADYEPQSTLKYSGERADDTAADVVDASDSDHYWENSGFTQKITVVYKGDTAEVTAPEGVIVTIEGAHVAIDMQTNAVEGVEVTVSGNSSDGSLKLYSGKKYKLTLAGVDLTSTRGAAINNQSAKRTFVHLEGDNYLTDAAELSSDIYYVAGASAETEDSKGCLFSEAHLIFSGNGLLCLIGNRKHAIACDDTFYMRHGVTIAVTCCAADALHTNEGATVAGGLLNIIAAGTDGIECDEGAVEITGGKVVVNSTDDAIVASYEGDDDTVAPDIKISGGEIALTTTAQKGMGLKAEGNIDISGGTIAIAVKGTASKCIKSTIDTSITGGKLTLSTSGNAMYDTAESDTASAACIKTGGNLSVGGSAVITASSSGSGGKGISTDGTLAVDSGTIDITTSGGQFVYSATKAGPGGGGGGGWRPDSDDSSGTTSSSKGIRADGNIIINGGTIKVKTSQTAASSDGSGCEGIESKGTITVNGGDIEVNAYDDGINAAKAIVIGGGRICSFSVYNDGIDSNGTLTVTGGLTIASGTRQPEEGFDCDQNTFKITGGIIIGTGGATSNPTTSVCSQRTIIASNLSMSEGSVLNIKNSAGTTLLNYALPRTLSGTTLLFSSPEVVSGGSYTFTTGGTVGSSSGDWNGYYSDGTYSGGSKANVSTSIK